MSWIATDEFKTKGEKIFYSFESLKNEKSNKIISKGIASISLVISPFCFLMLISISLTTRGRLELSKYDHTVASMMEGSSWRPKLRRKQDALHTDCFSSVFTLFSIPHRVPCTNSLWRYVTSLWKKPQWADGLCSCYQWQKGKRADFTSVATVTQN